MKTTLLFAVALIGALPLAAFANPGDDLLAAAEARDLRKTEALLNSGVDVNYVSPSHPGYGTALFVAMERISEPELFDVFHVARDIHYVRYLISRGADVNYTQPTNNTTPLLDAVSLGSIISALNSRNMVIANMLLDAGARVAGDFGKNDSPLFRLLELYPGDKHMGPVANAQFNALFDRLVKMGSDLKTTGRDYNRTLLFEAMYGHVPASTTEKLLKAGLDVNQQIEKDEMRTPLIALAATCMGTGTSARNIVENAKVLIAAGADPRLKDIEGKTALDHARYIDPKHCPPCRALAEFLALQ